MDGFVVHEVAPDVVVRVERAMPELPASRGPGSGAPVAGGEPAGGCRRGRADVQWPGVQRRRDRSAPHHRPSDRIPPRCRADGAARAVRRAGRAVVCGVRGAALCRWGGGGAAAPRGDLSGGHVAIAARRQRGCGCRGRGWQWPIFAASCCANCSEELGLGPDAVGEPRPLCIVEHPGSHVSDLGLALVTS